MAIRPVYIPSKSSLEVITNNVEFEWFSGFSKQQKQKSYNDLHYKAKRDLNIENILEVSSASEKELGRNLSAFNLSMTTTNNNRVTVETAFQGSKVFEKGGPYIDLYGTDSRGAKKDLRLKTSGNLIGFKFFKESFPLIPQTFFYDWIYLNTLHRHTEYRDEILEYDAFTDIEFNPMKSINNQAYSVALYVSLYSCGLIEEVLKDRNSFLEVLQDTYREKTHDPIQGKLF